MNVVITGTSSGLGQALKHRFEDDHHTVLGSTVSGDEVHASQLKLDLSVERSINEFGRQARIHLHDKIDVLINNAGVNDICRFEELNAMFIQRLMTVNFIGPVMLTRQLLTALTGGLVINIVSDAAWRPMRHSLAYNCSKAAFDMATRQMARELTKPYDVSIVGVRPGKMQGTGMSTYIDDQVCALRGWTSEQARAYAASNSVTGKELPAGVVANFVYYLALSGMGRLSSGACLDLAG